MKSQKPKSKKSADMTTLTLFPEGFLANQSVEPGSSEARMMTDFSGRRCLESSGNFTRAGSLQRMFMDSLVSSKEIYSDRCILTWKAKVTKRSRQLFYQLAASTPRIEDTESLLWRTPRNGKTTDENEDSWMARRNDGKVSTPPLTLAVKLWPTPRSSPNENRQIKMTPSQMQGKHGMNLSTAVNLFPTPPTQDHKAVGPKERERMENGEMESYDQRLRNFVLLPTPKSRDWKGQTQRGIHAQMDGLPNMDNGQGKVIGGKLNPEFVELLMGFPPGWTEISGMETGNVECQELQKELVDESTALKDSETP